MATIRKQTFLSLLPAVVLTAAVVAGPRSVRADELSIQPTPQQIIAQIEGQAEVEAAEEPTVGSAAFWSIGFDITNAYYFRGIIQEDQGFIIQPYAELGWQLNETFSFAVGIWNSFHDNDDTGSGGENFNEDGDPVARSTDAWYEADLYATIGVALPANFEFAFTYTAYTSPNSTFSTVQELMFALAYDDSALWTDLGLEGFALNPYIALAIEVDNTAFGPDEGFYLELGIEPAFSPFENGPLAGLEITIPVTLGLSLDDYYEVARDEDLDIESDNDAFGYLSVGVTGSIPLPIPQQFGNASLGAGVSVLFLGDSLEDANNGDDVEVIGTIGVSISN